MDVFTLHALRRGKNHTHRIVEAGSVISLTGDELKRVTDTVAARQATKEEVAAAKANGTYFDGAAVTESKATGSASAASTASSTTEPAKSTEPTVKPFDKMTKAELDKALTDSGFEAPENWATLKNFDRATFLQTETDKKAEADKAAAEGGNGGNGGSDDDLQV